MRSLTAKILPLDLASPSAPVLLLGVGRSGTTWAGAMINYNHQYRILFEPFWSKKVPAATLFPFPQYIPVDSEDEQYVHDAKYILNGKVRGVSIDRDNERLIYKKRLIKDIRCNLMIPWLKRISQGSPIIFMIRHPLQVTASWLDLEWKVPKFELIVSQDALIRDHPELLKLKNDLNPKTNFEKIVFLWCLYHYVPRKQLKVEQVCVVHYENLLTDFDQEASRIFSYLDQDYDKDELKVVASRPSSTNFQKRKIEKAGKSLLNSWNEKFSAKQIMQSQTIIRAFGLDDLYDKDGCPSGNFL